MMPKKLFNLKFTLIILVICVVPFVIYIIVNGFGNTYSMVKISDQLDGVISESIQDKGTNKYCFNDSDSGFYFFYHDEGSAKTQEVIHSFIIWNKTRVVKPKNKAVVYYINGMDTLKVSYKTNSSNRVLHSGYIVP